MEVSTIPTVSRTWDGVVADLDTDGNLGPVGRELDQAVEGMLTRLARAGELSGKVGDASIVFGASDAVPRAIAVVGIGPRTTFGPGDAFRAAATGLKALASRQRGDVGLAFPSAWSPNLWEAAIAGALTGATGQDLHRKQRRLFPPEKLYAVACPEGTADAGRELGEAINFARHLVNQPPNLMNPAALAEAAEQLAQQTGLECEVWDRARLEQENCHALLAVAAGSAAEPRLIILRHRGSAAAQPELALVGKGVTFDSGGLSIKPSDSMKEMKCDMAGAAAVLGTMQAAARLQIPRHIVGLIGSVENMLGSRAYKLGDVLVSRSGKTIEILNTDAEGRVVLADVLDVATSLKPARILDLATLTGACVVALGTDTVGLMANDAKWSDTVLTAARSAGEPVWPLPMFDFFAEQIRSQIADIKNTGDGRWGGAITAAKFLQEFVKDIPWVHLDIAGPAFSDTAKPWRDAGATGSPVRTLVELLRSDAW